MSSKKTPEVCHSVPRKLRKTTSTFAIAGRSEDPESGSPGPPY